MLAAGEYGALMAFVLHPARSSAPYSWCGGGGKMVEMKIKNKNNEENRIKPCLAHEKSGRPHKEA